MRKILHSFFAVLLLACPAFATFPVTAVMEINGSATPGNVNGGGFNPARTMTNNDLACSNATGATPTCTSAGDPFVASDDETWLFIQSGGTYTVNIFCRISDVTTGTATLDAAAGACNIWQPVASMTVYGQWTTNSIGIASTASPTGGVWGIDYSRSTANWQTTDTATNTAGVITVGGLTYRCAALGNILQIVPTSTGATQGWYEITACTLNVSYTLDRDPSGTTNMSLRLGGALSLGSTTANRTDTSVFQLCAGTNGTGSVQFFIKNSGTYTIGATLTITSAGGTNQPCFMRGYNTVRTDAPTGSTRPTINASTFAVTTGSQWAVLNTIWTGTNAAVVTLGANNVAALNKFVNTTTTVADRIAVLTGAEGVLIGNEAVSYAGDAINDSGARVTLRANYAHDSNRCIRNASTDAATIEQNIVALCKVAGIQITSGTARRNTISGNTIYGGETPMGIGVDIATGTPQVSATNNIIAGWVTGAKTADTQAIVYSNYNDFYNNTTARDKVLVGPNDQALNPIFTSVAELTGATATTTSGNHLVQSGATFVTSGVTAGRDYLYLVSGTGTTNAVFYGIASVDSETQITTDVTLTANATGDHAWRIVTGRNFAIGTNLKALGFPGTFPGGYTTGYLDIGAAQRQESASGGGGIIGGQ